MPKTLVFLPTYNEREYIETILSQALALGPDIEALVVDDDSPDGTADIVAAAAEAEPRAHLLVRRADRGRGRAMLDAIRWCLARDYDSFIEMDADGSHDPKYIPDIRRGLESADIVICSRLIPCGGERNRPFIRRWLTVLANIYIRFALGIAVRDGTTGFRGFRREALAAVDLDRVISSGPSIVQELLVAMLRKGFRAIEIPFIFEQRKAGRSKLNLRLLAIGVLNVWRMRKLYPRKLGE